VPYTKKRRSPRVVKTRITALIDYSLFLHDPGIERELVTESGYRLPDPIHINEAIFIARSVINKTYKKVEPKHKRSTRTSN